MLEQMRRSSQSLLIYVLFGILIAVFIINFAPQSMGGCEGTRTGSVESDAAKVGSRTLTVHDVRCYIKIPFIGSHGPECCFHAVSICGETLYEMTPIIQLFLG